MFVLDTDHLTLLTEGQISVTNRAMSVPASELGTTIVTIEEQLRGWYARLRKAQSDLNRLERAYRGLSQVIDIAASLRVLSFSRAALERHADLKRQFRRVGRLDLAIAAIVLENNATLVTRNRVDFEQIHGLQIQDWSV